MAKEFDLLHLVTLGRLELNDGAQPLLARRRKELVLLVYLARKAPRAVSRTELTDLLWGAKGEALARQSLRQALSTLRGVVGDALVTTVDQVRLDPAVVLLDVRRFEDSIETGDVAEAVSLWQGDFLAGADDIGDEHFRGWLERERSSLRARLGSAFQRLVEDDRAAGRLATEIDHATAWTQCLPFDEIAHYRLIESLRLAGRGHEARARYSAILSRLHDDLGVEPSPELARLGDSLGSVSSQSRIGARALLSPDIVGRGVVLGRLDDLWRRVGRLEHSVVLIIGEEGSGKSRLVREFARVLRASDSRAIILETRAFESQREAPWSTLRAALPELADAPGLLGAPPGAIAALATISPEIAERFPRHAASHTAAPAAEAVLRVLEEVATEAPLLIIVDDAPSADAATMSVLSALIRRTPAGSLLVLTAEREMLEDTPLATELRQAASYVTEIELPPLGVDDLELMVSSMVPLAPESARAVAERMHSASAGNPGHAERLVSAWADHGVLRPRPDGRWIPTRPLDDELPIPADVRNHALEKVRALSPDARRVAEAASVWTRAVAPALLEYTSGVPADRFASSLGELLSRRLLRESVQRPRTHEFTSDTARRAVYDSVPPSRRRVFHRAAARAARGLPPGPDREKLLREHSALGGRRVVTRAWAGAGIVAVAALTLAAGRAMMSRTAAVPRGARVVLADVENLTSDSSLGRTFYSAAAIALQNSRHVTLYPRARVRETLTRMRRPGADSAFDEHLAQEVAVREGLASVIVLGASQVDSNFLLTARLVNPATGADRGARSVRVTGRAALLNGLEDLLAMVRTDLGESREWMRDSTSRLPRITTSSLEALREFVDGRDAYNRQNFARALDHFERATTLDPEFALAHAFLSDVYWYARADRPAAKGALERALSLTDRLAERERLRIRAQAADRFGNPEEATALFETLAQRHPDRDTWYVLGDHHLQQGRCQEALPALYKSVEQDSLFHVSRIHIARCLIVEGDAAGALASLDAATRGDSLALLRANTNHVWGTAYVLAGDLARADSVYRLMLVRPGVLERARGHQSLAWLAMYRGQYRAAVVHLSAAIGLAARGGYPLSELRDRTVLAGALIALGNRVGAAAQLDTVAEQAGKLSVPPAFQVAIGMTALRLQRRAQARASLAAIQAGLSGGTRRDAAARSVVESALLLANRDLDGARRVAAADDGRFYQAYRRALEAQAFAAAGQVDSAAASAMTLSKLFAFGDEEQFVWLQAPLLLAEYSELRGDTAAALAAYRRVAERWKNGDPDLPELVKARRAIARLTRDDAAETRR